MMGVYDHKYVSTMQCVNRYMSKIVVVAAKDASWHVMRKMLKY